MIHGVITSVLVALDEVVLFIRGEEGEIDDSHIEVQRAIHPTNYEVRVGDEVWWQGNHIYWNPVGSSRKDIPLPRIRRSYTGEVIHD
jgi:hypothetical protein